MVLELEETQRKNFNLSKTCKELLKRVMHFSATKIQGAFRGYLDRKKEAVTKIQEPNWDIFLLIHEELYLKKRQLQAEIDRRQAPMTQANLNNVNQVIARYSAYGSFLLPAGLDLSKVHSWSIQDGTPLRYVEVEGGPEEEIQEETDFDADWMISYKPAETIVAPFQKMCECGDDDNCRLPLSDIESGVKITNLAEDPTTSSQPFTGTLTYSPDCEIASDMFSEDWIYDADAMFTVEHIKAFWQPRRSSMMPVRAGWTRCSKTWLQRKIWMTNHGCAT